MEKIMECKTLEIRDRMTFIPALAVNINSDNEAQRYLMQRCGYPCNGEPNIILTKLAGECQASNDPYSWIGSRTLQTCAYSKPDQGLESVIRWHRPPSSHHG